MPLYSTGEVAQLCGTTVRTVQYYDAQGLLKPSTLSEGGRRLYTEQDRELLQLICLLRSLDLPVAAIRDLLAQENPQAALVMLLEEQDRRVRTRMREDGRLLAVIGEVRASIEREGRVPRQSRDGIEHDMEGRRRFRRTRAIVFGVGIAVDLVEWSAFIYALVTHNWLPFAVAMPFVLAAAVPLVLLYHRDAAYLCPQCHEKFRPGLREFALSRHTPTMRKLTCTACGTKGYCVETFADCP